MVRIDGKGVTARKGCRIMDALLLAQFGDHAQIYQDRKGLGRNYFVLKYYERPDPLGPPRQRSLYLGRLEQWAVDHIAKAVAVNAEQRAARKAGAHQLRSLHDRIGVVRVLNRTAMILARQVAKDCGFDLKGYELRRKRE